jgi:hypothetical protein
MFMHVVNGAKFKWKKTWFGFRLRETIHSRAIRRRQNRASVAGDGHASGYELGLSRRRYRRH